MSTYTARTAEDLLAIAPAVLGFRPRESVVMMTFGSPAGAFHARIDMPQDDDEIEQVVRLMVNAALKNSVRVAAVLVYTEDEPASVRAGLALVDGLLLQGIVIIEAIRVDETHFWRLPEEVGTGGTAYDLSVHPFTAERVLEGQVVHASREEMAATLAPVRDEGHDRMLEAAMRYAEGLPGETDLLVARLGEDLAWMEKRVRRYLRDDRPLPPAVAGKLLVLSQQLVPRDRLRQLIDREQARRHVEVWTQMVRWCPESLIAGPGTVLAYAAWMAGDGALAWCALDRVLAVEPHDPFALHLADLLSDAVPPQMLDGPRLTG